MNAKQIIATLKLKPHPEGGWYRETFRDKGRRAHSSAIYFLLERGQTSRWHRVDAAEVWHFYAGAALELLIAKNRRKPERHLLGNDLAKSEQPQIMVPAKHWQAARSTGAYTLVGCTVAPGFLFEKFELAESPNAWEAPSPKRGRSRATMRGLHSRGRD